ncbi:hypothetical protein CPC08DRAFT_722992 [Agrocybe pediades]|nr:hypothetical protein CPC08DRAFT_722992 [Agrocybe pediades]
MLIIRCDKEGLIIQTFNFAIDLFEGRSGINNPSDRMRAKCVRLRGRDAWRCVQMRAGLAVFRLTVYKPNRAACHGFFCLPLVWISTRGKGRHKHSSDAPPPQPELATQFKDPASWM